jgi:hypothetical protein
MDDRTELAAHLAERRREVREKQIDLLAAYLDTGKVVHDHAERFRAELARFIHQTEGGERWFCR